MKTAQNSQENTCAKVFFLIKSQALGDIFKNTCFTEHFWVTTFLVCKLHNYKNKTNILRNCNHLRNATFFIKKDFGKGFLSYKKELLKELKPLDESKLAYLNYKTVAVRKKIKI